MNELVLGVNIALDTAAIDMCRSFDLNGNDGVEVNELITGVNNLLGSCPPPMGDTPTPTPTGTATPTATLPDPTATPDLAPPARAVAARAAGVANAMSALPSLIGAIAAGFDFGDAAGAATGGGVAAAACPEGGSATRDGDFDFPPNITITLNACRVQTADGFVTYDGTVTVMGFSFTADVTAAFTMPDGTPTVTNHAMIAGNVSGIPGLGGECEITALTLTVTSGSVSATTAGGMEAAIMFQNTTVSISNITFDPSCEPVVYRLTFNGAAALLSGDAQPVSVTFNMLRLDVDEQNDPTLFTLSGGMTSPCFGGAATFATSPPLAVPDDEVCPVQGVITATFSGGTARVIYNSDQSVDVDSNNDGTVDDSAPNCLDARLLMCAA